MDYIKVVCNQLHDSIQQSDLKGWPVEGTGLQTPQVALTPATAMNTLCTELTNPSGPEHGDIASLAANC
eukprot:621845-Rhodomonas_salina.2